MSNPNPNLDQDPTSWGAIAPDYARSFEGLSSQFAADALRLLDVKPGERVIDIAAGTGAFSLLAARASAFRRSSHARHRGVCRDRACLITSVSCFF